MDSRNGTWRPGAIVWRELATTDLERSTAFYGGLLGWTHHDSHMGGQGIYRHFEHDGVAIGGAYELGVHRPGVPAHWLHYLSVPDVDAALATALAAGATLHMGPYDIPGVGRAAYIADPQGASVALFRDLKGDFPAVARAPLGTFCWESLITTSPSDAVAFYTKAAGMVAGDFFGNAVLSSGPNPEDGVADVGPAPEGTPSHWLSHLVVADLDDARARAVALGATVLVPEIVVPHVGRMAFIADPVGCVVSLYQRDAA